MRQKSCCCVSGVVVIQNVFLTSGYRRCCMSKFVKECKAGRLFRSYFSRCHCWRGCSGLIAVLWRGLLSVEVWTNRSESNSGIWTLPWRVPTLYCRITLSADEIGDSMRPSDLIFVELDLLKSKRVVRLK